MIVVKAQYNYSYCLTVGENESKSFSKCSLLIICKSATEFQVKIYNEKLVTLCICKTLIRSLTVCFRNTFYLLL